MFFGPQSIGLRLFAEKSDSSERRHIGRCGDNQIGRILRMQRTRKSAVSKWMAWLLDFRTSLPAPFTHELTGC